MQTILLTIGIILAVLLNVLVLVMLMRRKSDSNTIAENEEARKANETGVKLLLDQMNSLNQNLNQTIDRKIGETNRVVTDSMRNQHGESTELVDKFLKEMRVMTEKVTRVEETGKQMVSFADQLQGLQDILTNPKQRGVLGEYYVETLLKNVLPPNSYEMQYAFNDGEIVDAIVRVKDKIIPIDSKFSLENYNRLVHEKNQAEKDRYEKAFVNDLKLRIQETSKYIRPNEGTMDFAFMFIPHEAIYYDLLVNTIGAVTDDTDNLIQRAANKYKVIIVSPTSFLAYLQTVLQGLKALQIEETAKDIIKRVDELGKHLKRYDDYHTKLGSNLATVVNQYNASSKELKKVDKDVLRITGTEAGIESPIAIEKPDQEE